MNTALPKSLKLLGEIAETLASKYLSKYTADISVMSEERFKSKEINDALWGTISLSVAEVVVLDSPLLQRLRYLRQMGAANWVYPGAVHTRFEHALGALHQTQQLIDSLNSGTDEDDEMPLLDKQGAQLLRLSSLFSHVGYLAFSDSLALEIGEQPVFATIMKDFAAATETEPKDFGADPTFCQLLAYFIVKSSAVKDLFLTLIQKKWIIDDDKNEVDAVEYAVNYVAFILIGRRVDDNCPQLQGLVNGPFDSSVLDSLVRDANFSGIPSILDIRRLTQKLVVQSARLDKLPDWITSSQITYEQNNEEYPSIRFFGVPASAASILNELQLAHLLVSTKIRRHPKVLAVEQMLRSVVSTLGQIFSPKDLLIFLYSSADDVLISMDVSGFKAYFCKISEHKLTDTEEDRLIIATRTLSAIRERRIWGRALQLSDSIMNAGSEANVGINRFYSELRHVQRGSALISSICDEVYEVLQASGEQVISKMELQSQITLCSLPPLSAEGRVGRAVVLPPNKIPHMLRDTWEGGDNWVDQYLRGQPAAYLFTAPELADAVYIASERIVDRVFKAKLPSGTLEASKRDKNTLRNLKRRTSKLGFWYGHSWSIRPQAAVWSSKGMSNRIQDVAFKLNKIETISAGETDLRDAVYRWLMQFENDNDIECALTMLECFEIIDRKKTTEAFKALFETYPRFKNAYAVSFGDPKDGGVIQGYFAADQSEIVKVVTLDQWVRETEDRPLIFVDDCCGSGSQVCDILAAWLEREDLRQHLGENRSAQLKEVREKLMRTDIVFLFITAWEVGVRKITEQLNSLSLQAFVFPYLSDADIPFVSSSLLERGKRRADIDKFIDRCSAIGAEILSSKGVGMDKIEDRKFGYGNRGMLLSTLVNVPTQTATLIWEEGQVDGVRWEALLPRRKKQ